MTSIHTNRSALAALGTLRTITSDMSDMQGRLSAGLNVRQASDNAAYWSVSTTIKSDRMAISAVSDALGLAAAKVDVAYTGLSSVIDVLSEFKAKLIAAKEPGVDKAKIQTELQQLKDQVTGIAASSSFNGVNWLNTDVSDIYDSDLNRTSLVSSFVRDEAGGVSVKTMDLHLSAVSLFNSTGGGLLQPDARDLKTIGGIRLEYYDQDGESIMSTSNLRGGARASFTFGFSGPLTFDDPSDAITFDVTVDADDPATGIDPAFDLGITTSVTIDRSTVDAAVPSAHGVISDYEQYIRVLGYALSQAHSGAAAGYVYTYVNGHSVPVKDAIAISSQESSGLDGSYVEVSSFSSNVGSGGLGNAADFGVRGSTMSLSFQPFEVYKEVQVSLDFNVNGAPSTSYGFDRDYVNTILGKETGKVETADEMVTLVSSLIGNDWPGVIIESNNPSSVTVRSDPATDRLSGLKTSIGFTGISVNIEPLSKMNFADIDVEKNPAMVRAYIRYIDNAQQKIIDGAATLGALQKRIQMQSSLTDASLSNITRGVGRLVDANMNEVSTKVKALQTQQQLGIQALQIANAASNNIIQLFR